MLNLIQHCKQGSALPIVALAKATKEYHSYIKMKSILVSGD
jgi:hypothetical protein